MYIWELTNWPDFTFNYNELVPHLESVRRQQTALLGQGEKLSKELDLEAQMDALIQSAIRTSEIEGEMLDVESVRSSVARQLGMQRAGIQGGTEQTDALVGMLLEATQALDTPLTQAGLCTWQSQLFPDGPGLINPIKIGQLRGETPMRVLSGRIEKPVLHFEAPPRDRLELELNAFLDWFNRPPKDLDAILRAGIAHLWLVTLHPFDDGNGRITRAITDRALAQAEQQSIRFYSLSAAIMERRKEYYAQLEKAQKGDMDITPWLRWFLGVLELALKQGRARFDRVLDKSRFWYRHSQTPLTARQIKVLNRLLDVGAAQEDAEGFEHGINAEKYKSLTRVSKATATRDLTDLLEKGCLTKLPSGGRSTRYAINYSDAI
ncbi:MAG: Fic family protein [Gammaproteobacteria bacterium]